jgi:putative hydrolase of the HAD superfamily
MAINPIRAVLFDMGGTLENLTSNESIRREATQGLRELLCELGVDPGLSVPDLQSTVLSGIATYQAWRDKRKIELPPERVWAEYVFADHGLCKKRLATTADDIAMFYETHYYARSLRPEAPATLEALHERGYRLAIISNVMSRKLVPCKLDEYGIAHYFDPVVTSSCLGWRKPSERIFGEATRLMQLAPEACAYVGDTVSRDVIGARRAGYGLAIQIRSFLTAKADLEVDAVQPDAVIADLRQVVAFLTRDTETSRDD